MRAVRRTVTIALLTGAAACAPITPAPTPLDALGAWVTYWDSDNGLRAARAAPPLLKDVFYFGVNLDADGRPVAPRGAPPEFDMLRARQRRVWLTVVNDIDSGTDGRATVTKDAAVVARVLATAESRAQHAALLVDYARRGGYDGIDIDYENLRAADRAAFTDFIERLAGAARARQLGVSVTVQPKARDAATDGAGAADWRALCAHADRVQIMLYNEHSGKTGPGPIASARWIRDILAYAARECPRERIVPALKVSGAVWSDAGVRGIQYDEAVAMARAAGVPVERDADDRTPHYTLLRDGARQTVYFEDAASIAYKVTVLRELGFSRVVFWSIGRHDPALFAGIVGEAGE